MNNELQRIEPRPCDIEQCHHTAHWSYRGTAICYEDMQVMSDMNSDNEEAFAPALAHAEEE